MNKGKKIYEYLNSKRLKRKKGIGGLIFILVTAIMTFTLNTTVKLSTSNNLKYVMNSALYFVGNKAAVNLYNSHSPSGTYTIVPRVGRTGYDLTADYNYILQSVYPDAISGNCPYVTVVWDKDSSTATVNAGPMNISDIGAMSPNEQNIIIEK